jgi:hypothetical protein
MPLIHSLYSRAIQVVPRQTAPMFGQTLLLCHKAFLCAAVTIGRRHPDDAAPITRRAIEAASLAVAVKVNPQNFERWQDYKGRSARWAARHKGEKTPPFKPPRIDYPRSLDRLRSHLGTLSDAYVHFTPEFAAGQEWRRNRRGEQAYAELGYLTVDAEAIARELFISGSFYVEILEVLDSECFEGAFNKDAEWKKARKVLEVVDGEQLLTGADANPVTDFRFLPDFGGRENTILTLPLTPGIHSLRLEVEAEGFAFAGTATPEPTTLVLWGTGAAGLGLARWYRRRGRKHEHAA